MDVNRKFLIVAKHVKRKGKTVRRAVHESQEMPLMLQLANGYAQKHGEDYLIVQVIAEVSKPKPDAKDLPPQ